MTGRRITAHSGRRGLVTTDHRKGKQPEKLCARGGWAKNSPVFWVYVDEGEKWEDNAIEGIGLRRSLPLVLMVPVGAGQV
ncbi:hypothetical protein [Streptomyces tanashiensis]|uniref:hypothetical protein n=1 Tax=Streptomyces tanashiensis TaxID=67367 RepID=UPI0033E84919